MKASQLQKDVANTKQDQLVSELLRVLAFGWKGEWKHFDRFSASYLTQKGEALAKAIPVGSLDRKAAAAAINAGY